MTQAKHIIKRQVIEVQMSPGMNRVEIQERVAQLYNQEIIHLVDTLLTQHSPHVDNRKIDRIELDLGQINVKDLAGSFTDKIETELKIKLAELKSAAVMVNEKEVRGSNHNGNFDLVVYFLKTGSFPWWAPNITSAILNSAFANVIVQNDPVVANSIMALSRDEAVFKRLVYSLTDSNLERLVSIFIPAKNSLLQDLKNEFRLLLPAFPPTAFNQSWWMSLIKMCFEQNQMNDAIAAETVIRIFDRSFKTAIAPLLITRPKALGILNKAFDLSLQTLPMEEMEKARRKAFDIEQALENLIHQNAVADVWDGAQLVEMRKNVNHVSNYFGSLKTAGWLGTKSVEAELRELSRSLNDLEFVMGQLARETQSSAHRSLSDIEIRFQHIERLLQKMKSATLQVDSSNKTGPLKREDNRRGLETKVNDTAPDRFSQSDKIYIHNCGLVLLWPFLVNFFTNLGVINEKAFVNDAAAEKACWILQYLIEGEADNVFEAQLPLNKLLCGIQLEQPVQTRFEMNASEAVACHDFIGAVIAHAPLWKNLSIGGFRQAYLKREGMLSSRDGHWLLQVKRETHDVIIDRLPWTMHVVKLPWMNSLLFVEWQKV